MFDHTRIISRSNLAATLRISLVALALGSVQGCVSTPEQEFYVLEREEQTEIKILDCKNAYYREESSASSATKTRCNEIRLTGEEAMLLMNILDDMGALKTARVEKLKPEESKGKKSEFETEEADPQPLGIFHRKKESRCHNGKLKGAALGRCLRNETDL